MLKIGLISDTHNYLDPQVLDYFADCDEIWHAGDFGNIEIADRLKEVAPVIGVYGNIDGHDIRREYPVQQRFTKEGVNVWMTHIGGQPGRYALPIRKQMEEDPPDLFICGHSHILKIARDKENNNLIFMNPGAAGKHGFQVWRTIVRFEITNGGLHNVEVIHLGKMGEPDDED
ncbi:MAG: metallophosphoesterase family protein [Bacteroidota bacterium]